MMCGLAGLGGKLVTIDHLHQHGSGVVHAPTADQVVYVVLGRIGVQLQERGEREEMVRGWKNKRREEKEEGRGR